MSKQHDVQGIDFDEEQMYLTVDGQTYKISIAQASPRLANATYAERC